MAQDWIKLEKNTPDKPEVAIIAAALQLDPDSVLGKLVRVWAWFDSNTTDGVTNVTVKALLDRIAGVTGFMAAMEMAGWAVETEDGQLLIPHFDRHMGKSAKTRAMTALRVAKSREETQKSVKSNAPATTDVTHPPLPKALPEREREGDSTHTLSAGARAGEAVIEEGRALPPGITTGFPEKSVAMAYATSKGYDLREALTWWSNRDVKRSSPVEAIDYRIRDPHFAWTSDLDQWILNNARLGGPRGGGGKSAGGGNGRKATITEHEPAGDWEDWQVDPAAKPPTAKA